MIFASIITASLLVIGFSTSSSFAESSTYQTEIIPINSSMGIEKSTLQMNISKDNKLPWGFVEGTIQNHVSDYPVIIQIFDNDDPIQGNNYGVVHFAQTTVNDDGSYEYKFRVLDNNENKTETIFHGSYTVKIFIVYLQSNFDVI